MAGFKVKVTSGEGGGSEKPPAGNHPAALVAIIDMGTQEQEFQGKQTKGRRAFFVWELLTEKVSGTKDRNHVIGIDLTVSLNEKAKMRKFIEARTGKKIQTDDYDITTELGAKCLLSVVLNSGGYPKVDGVASVPKGLPFPEPQNKPFAIDLDQIRAGAEIPEWVPYLYGKPIGDHIAECVELRGKPALAGADATIPF